jgi:hypothetical protein
LGAFDRAVFAALLKKLSQPIFLGDFADRGDLGVEN